EIVVGRVDAGVRIAQEEIDTVEPRPVRELRLRRQVEHRVEIDRRLGAGPALADQSGPHGVVECWLRVSHLHLRGASGLPGPKCFRITKGSESLRFSTRTPW